jgi:serine phosphatase RsbU (regulator of sigma subunit)
MRTAPSARILLCSDSRPDNEVQRVLLRAGFAVSANGVPPTTPDAVAGFDLIVLDGSGQAEAALRLCQTLRLSQGEQFVPILFISDDHSPATRLASLQHGADTYLLRPFDPSELLAQVQALVRIKDRQDRLTEKTEEVHRINKRLQQAYQQIDQELELASRIQASFLPHSLPALPQVRFAVHYHPAARVGGDFYDVFRLDERHFGFFVADAMGHGVPASLLTIFVKKGIKVKDITGNSYRLVPPNEVLQRLNQDLIEQSLSDNPFITMIYLLFNYTDGTLQFSRAGHPFPLYVPHDGPPRLWQCDGTLLGVFQTGYSLRREQLRPRDKLLLYTDGVDGAVSGDQPRGTASLLACVAEHRALSIGELVPRVAAELFGQNPQKDDLTLLGMEVL